MTKEEKKWVLISVIVAIIIWLLTRKATATVATVQPIQAVASLQIDTRTGLEVGFSGIKDDPATIGPVITPIGTSNNINDSNFLKLLANGGSSDIPLCPIGYRPIIDPSDLDVYCTQNGYGNAAQQVPNTFIN